jgi:hypothetical protein
MDSVRKSEDSRRTSLPRDDLSAMSRVPDPSLSLNRNGPPGRVRVVFGSHGSVFDIPLTQCLLVFFACVSIRLHNSTSPCSR